MVRITSASAGLAPGKNFRKPKARKTRPRLIRRMSMLCRPSQPEMRLPLTSNAFMVGFSLLSS